MRTNADLPHTGPRADFECRDRVGAIRFKQRQFPTDNGWRVDLQGDQELKNQKKENPEVGHRLGPGPPRGPTTSPTARSERVERQRDQTHHKRTILYCQVQQLRPAHRLSQSRSKQVQLNKPEASQLTV